MTERRRKNKISLVEKLAKTAKRIIELLIKLPIYCQRAFQRLNHCFIPDRTVEKFFFVINRDASKDNNSPGIIVDGKGTDGKTPKEKNLAGRKTS